MTSNRKPKSTALEQDLIQDVIPFVESHYPVIAERQSRALPGSRWRGQALNIGLTHLGTFAWIGAFSAGRGTAKEAALIPMLRPREEITSPLDLLRRQGLCSMGT